MDFNLNDEQQMLRDGVERFVRENYKFETRRDLLNTAEGFSRENWQQFGDLGWIGMSFPEDAGGLGFSFVETAIILEQFGRGLVMEPYAINAVLCSRIIDRSGSKAHRDALLPAIAEGKLLVALAHAEAGSRFDLKAVKATTAKAAGKGFTINGTKTLVVSAPTADKLIVSAAVAGGFALFLVDRKAPGVKLREYRLIDGTGAADIEFKDVAAEQLVDAKTAYDVLEEATDRATLGAVAEALGAMEQVLDLTSEYLKTRVQFGQPIGKFQALQHRLAEMFVETQETRSIMYRGLASIDADPKARRAAVSAAKVYVGNAGRFVGGHYYKKLVTIEKLYGDTDHHLERFIANQ
jgi:alkylation response protein AidB-like acyl-CoA dehydrogenase